MRIATLALIPLLGALAAEPAAAQISATIHVGPIRIGSDRGYPSRIAVIDYPSRRYGDWRQTARMWRPITVYYFGGQYYQRPFRNAKPVVIYRYRDQYFHAPRDRGWNDQRSRYERNEWRQWRNDRGDGWRDDDRRDDRRDNRADRRDDRQDNRDDRRDNRADRRDDRRDRGRRG